MNLKEKKVKRKNGIWKKKIYENIKK